MAWRCLIKPKPKPKPKPAAHFVIVYTQANPKYAWSGLATTAAVLDQDVTITARLPDGTIIKVRGEPESEIVRGALRIGGSLVGKAVGEARATMEQMLPIVVDKVTVTRATDVEGVVPLATDKVFKPIGGAALSGSILTATDAEDGERVYIAIALFPGCAACLHVAHSLVACHNYLIDVRNTIRRTQGRPGRGDAADGCAGDDSGLMSDDN